MTTSHENQEYMRQLMKFVQVDSYGAYLENKPGLVGRYGKDKGTDQISEMPNPFWPDDTSLLWYFLTKTATILSMLNYTMLGKLAQFP